MIAHQWQPIQPIDAASERYDFGEIDALQRQWRNILELRGDAAFRPYLERLERSWAIETGIIEGLYTLDRGVTETLIQRGIVAEYIERSSTNKEPQDLVAVLNDHQEAIELVHQYIRGSHSLKRSFIRQLHQVITRHQDTYTGVTQFGKRYNPPLDKGGFKKLPNNPTRPDGKLHQYCPPEQVDSEIDNLLYFYNEMQREAYHPILTGAWLHHAFTQIHPFQDGNGRVVRALLTWHLVKENYLPIVIYRDGYEEYSQSRGSREERIQPRNSRKEYIQALELADGGDLNPFIDLIVQLEKRTILQALGEPEPVDQTTLFDQMLDSIVEQGRRRNQERESNLRSVNEVALKCRGAIASILENAGAKIYERLSEAGLDVHPVVNLGGPDYRSEHYYATEIEDLSKRSQHQVNWSETRYFARLSLRVRNDRQPRLVFVVCLYHTGRNLTGIMAAAAFARIEPDNVPNQDGGEQQSPYYRNCAVTPLTFTWQDNEVSLQSRFDRWVEESLVLALKYWQESMA